MARPDLINVMPLVGHMEEALFGVPSVPWWRERAIQALRHRVAHRQDHFTYLPDQVDQRKWMMGVWYRACEIYLAAENSGIALLGAEAGGRLRPQPKEESVRI